MPRRVKQLLYSHYWWCAALLFAIGTALIVRLHAAQPLNNLIALGGGIAGTYYFLQKQHLAELELFERLFVDFNRRYGQMNDRLQLLLLDSTPLTRADCALLEDYFNLCAEEYFYYSSGIIDSRVWSAWCRGMAQYLAEPRIADFWRDEESGNSYYGLTRAVIEAEGRVTHPLLRTTSARHGQGRLEKRAA